MRYQLHTLIKKIDLRFALKAALSILICIQSAPTVAATPELDREIMRVISPESTPTAEQDKPRRVDKKLAKPDQSHALCSKESSHPIQRQVAGTEERRPSTAYTSLTSDGLLRAAKIAIQRVTPPLKSIYKKKGSVGRNGTRRSSFHCAAYVRVALEKANLINRGGLHRSAQAKYYGCGLKKNGFFNLCGSSCEGPRAKTCKMTPGQAPMGSVLVYDDTGCGHPAGHIEIKAPQGYVSDYLSLSPRTGNNKTRGKCRRLVGIWVK